MPDDSVNNPHDLFARHALRDPERAAMYVERNLPAEVTRELDAQKQINVRFV